MTLGRDGAATAVRRDVAVRPVVGKRGEPTSAVEVGAAFGFVGRPRRRAAGAESGFRTDGKRLWLDDLADYVDNHALAIPRSWLAEIEARNYAPPMSVAEDLLAALEWPPTA